LWEDENHYDVNELHHLGDKMKLLEVQLSKAEYDIEAIYDGALGSGIKRSTNKKNTGQIIRGQRAVDKKILRRGGIADNKAEGIEGDFEIGKKSRVLEKKCLQEDCMKGARTGQDYCDQCFKSIKTKCLKCETLVSGKFKTCTNCFRKTQTCRLGAQCTYGDKCRFLHLAVKEAILVEKGDVDSHKRQISNEKKAIVKLYKKRNDGVYRFVGHCFKAKYMDKEIAISASHVVDSGIFFLDSQDSYQPCEFKHHPSKDVAVCEEKALLKTMIGKIFKLGDTCGDFKRATFKTRDVKTGKDVECKCDGYVEDGFFKHDSDTFEGQCGTPYLVKNSVKCVHIETDGVTNIGTACTCDIISEILN
jgi:hypothetical protein